VFGRLIKLAHYLALIGFIGGLAASSVLGAFADKGPTSIVAAMRLAIVDLGESLAVPSLIAVLASGMLLVVARATLAYARWVWAKAAVAAVIAIIVLAFLEPAERRAAELAREAALGTPSSEVLSSAVSAEQVGGAIVLALALLARGLAIWRPRLGRPTAQRSEESD
jgi:hypothetical protein